MLTAVGVEKIYVAKNLADYWVAGNNIAPYYKLFIKPNLFAMKKATLLTYLGLVIGSGGYAQIQNLTLGEHIFTLSSVNLKMGFEVDAYPNMSPEWMKDHTKDPSQIDFDASGFQTASHAQVSAVSLGGNLAFTNSRKRDGRLRTARELRFGLDAIVGGEAMVTFTETDERTDSTYTQNLVYCLVENEFRVGGEYRYKASWGRFNTFVGGGAQLGVTMNSEMLVLKSSMVWANEGAEQDQFVPPSMETMDTERYDAKSSIYLRAFVPFGISVRICRRMELGMEHRLGLGVEQVVGGAANFMRHTGITYFTLGYHFDKYQKGKKSDVTASR